MVNLKYFKPNLRYTDVLILPAYCSLIYFLSSYSKVPTPLWFEHQDKFIHLIAYAVMAALSWCAFRHYLSRLEALAIASLLFSSFYGLTDEWHQSFVPGRHADTFDWLADTAGALLMVLLIYKMQTQYYSAKIAEFFHPVSK